MALPALDKTEELRLEDSPKWVRARLDGKTVADSRQAKLVRGSWGPPRTYAFPPEDVEGVPADARIEVDGFVAVQWEAMDGWYEESEEVFVHPRDPHKRIDVLESSRQICIELEGEVLAESRRMVVLMEPGLPTRYYLNHEDIDMGRLRDAGKTTACPYKGWADHYDVKVAGEWKKAFAWTYRAPLREVLPVRGLVAFYNERVDIIEDGQRLERPKTPFS